MSADHKARGDMADVDAALAEFERWTTGFDSRSAPEYRHRVLRQDGEAYDVIHYRRTREGAEQACRTCAMAAALEAAAHVRAGQDHGGEASEVDGLRTVLDWHKRQLRVTQEALAVTRSTQASVSARAAKAVEVLRQCEWPGDSMAQPQCPCCRRYKEWGHMPDCSLATLLSDHTAPEPGVEAWEVRNAVLEEAAKVVEKFGYLAALHQMPTPTISDPAIVLLGNKVSEAIRALQTTTDGGRDGK